MRTGRSHPSYPKIRHCIMVTVKTAHQTSKDGYLKIRRVKISVDLSLAKARWRDRCLSLYLRQIRSLQRPIPLDHPTPSISQKLSVCAFSSFWV